MMADLFGREYERVPDSELRPAREQIDTIIRQLQKELRATGVTFKPKLIGSAGKHLVTRIIGGNKGFDFDYNFSIQKGADMDERELKRLFMEELRQIIAGTQYSNISDSRQTMTIKVVDHHNSRIIHSCDFAIVHEDLDDDGNLIQMILVKDRDSNRYYWNEKESAKNYVEKISNLRANGHWNEVRDEYLQLKNNNMQEGKRSHTLFYEAINNVYNRYDWH